MDRNSLLRTAFIALILLGGYWFFFGRKSGEHFQSLPPEHYVSAPGFVPDPIDGEPAAPGAPTPPEQTCVVKGNRFEAQLSSHGAGLTLRAAPFTSDETSSLVVDFFRRLGFHPALERDSA